jgi:hypothetical protein
MAPFIPQDPAPLFQKFPTKHHKRSMVAFFLYNRQPSQQIYGSSIKSNAHTKFLIHYSLGRGRPVAVSMGSPGTGADFSRGIEFLSGAHTAWIEESELPTAARLTWDLTSLLRLLR